MKKKIILVPTFLAGIFISNFLYEFFFYSKKNTPQLETLPFYYGCPLSQRHLVSFRSHTVVHKDFVEKFDLKNKPEVAVSEQMKYLGGLFHYAKDEYRGLPELPFNIKVIKVSETSYDNDLDFDYKNFSSDIYPKNFFNPRKVTKEEPAIRIDYEASFNLTICYQKKDLTKLKLLLPRDPYLAYWEIPVSNRIVIKNHGQSESANPCVADRYAVFKYPPHFWYTYQPRRIHESPAFDCSGYLEKKQKIIFSEAVLKKEIENEIHFSLDQLEKLPKIEASIAFALLSDKENIQKKFSDLVVYFKKNSQILNYIKHKNNLLEHLKTLSKDQDQSLIAVLFFLHEANKIFKLETSEIAFQNDHLILKTHGVLENINKKISFSIYLGGNALSSDGKSYWNFVKESLEKSDLFFYVSHSGHGENMKLESLMNALSLEKNEFRNIIGQKKYQFIGIMSCFSTFFHSNEIKKFVPKSKTIDLMLMGSDGYNYFAPLLPLAKLNKKYFTKILNLLGNENILTIKRITYKD